ncbi:MAG: hypothetical protein KC442_10805 [Thermomicrobiales bacterium]|nr:hypothetical protein [Thermomicrobiales bacterium]
MKTKVLTTHEEIIREHLQITAPIPDAALAYVRFIDPTTGHVLGDGPSWVRMSPHGMVALETDKGVHPLGELTPFCEAFIDIANRLGVPVDVASRDLNFDPMESDTYGPGEYEMRLDIELELQCNRDTKARLPEDLSWHTMIFASRSDGKTQWRVMAPPDGDDQGPDPDDRELAEVDLGDEDPLERLLCFVGMKPAGASVRRS